MSLSRWARRACILSLGLAVVLLMTACPPVVYRDTAKLFVLFTGGADNAKCEEVDKGEVPLDDIQSLVVTLTEVTLQKAAQVYTGAKRAAHEGEGDRVVIFEGAQDIELTDLTDVAALIASADVYAGRYTKIRLSVEDPRLILAAEPDQVITDVQLTANGRLFVSEPFTIVAGVDQLLVLDLGGIHLVHTGNGKFVLTPQLRADISFIEQEALAIGRIVEVYPDDDELLLLLDDGTEISVLYAGAPIYLPADTDTPTGGESDLLVDSELMARGAFDADGVLTASELRLYSQESP